MNERIKELAEQAEWSVRWGNPNNYEEYNRSLDEWQEKFAELIIRECAGLVNDQLQHNNPNDSLLALKIKEHFGVEE